MTMTPEQASAFQETFGRLVANVEQVLLGKTFVIRLGFVALFSEGHLLLEDFPGTGKTSLARAIAHDESHRELAGRTPIFQQIFNEAVGVFPTAFCHVRLVEVRPIFNGDEILVERLCLH